MCPTHSALIFKVNKLGDSVVFLPVVQRLVTEAAFERLILWTTPLAAPLYGSQTDKLRLEVTSREDFYPAWKNPRRLLKLIRRVRRARANFALVAEDMGNTAFLLSLLSGARHRLGARPPYLKIPAAINREVHLTIEAPAAEKAWQLGRTLAESAGCAPWEETPPPPDLSHLHTEDANSFDILIHPGASRAYQRWSGKRFADLATRLSRDFRVGWFETPDAPPPIGEGIEILRPTSLNRLVSHFHRTSLLIANNSGPMHVASALGIPLIALCGPSARTWDPYWHKERCRILRQEDLPCIACDPPGLPPLDVCTNTASPMACMEYWTVDRVESEARSWHARWRSLRP